MQLKKAPSVITRRNDTTSAGTKKHSRQKSSITLTTLPKRIKAMQSVIDQQLQADSPTTSELVSEALKRFFTNKRATFRTSQQRETVKSVIN